MEDPSAVNTITSESVNSFSSKIIEIVAGVGQRKLFAHASVLSQSEKLKALVEGEWADSKKILLPEWEEENVAMMLDWLYGRDYDCSVLELPQKPAWKPNPKMKEKASAMISNEVRKISTKKQYSPPERIGKVKFTTAQTDGISRPPQFVSIQTWSEKVSCEEKMKHDFESTLSPHVKLYALANYMLLEELKQAAFLHIQDWLSMIMSIKYPDFRERTVTSLVGHLKYVYDHTNSLRSSREPLRELFSTFFASNFIHIDTDNIRELIEGDGDIMVDVWGKVRRCGESLELQLKDLDEEPDLHFWRHPMER